MDRVISSRLQYYKSELRKYGIKDFIFTRIFYIKSKLSKKMRRYFRLIICPVWEMKDSNLIGHWNKKHKSIQSLLLEWEEEIEKRFFIPSSDKKDFSEFMLDNFPQSVKTTLKQADDVMKNIYDILGSGPTELEEPLPWDMDIKTSYRYGGYSQDINYDNMEKNDPKVPWELSRFNFAIVLGKAYWYTGDEKYAIKYLRLFSDWIEKNPYDWGVNWICPMEAAIRPIGMMWGYFFFSSSPHFTEELKIKLIKTLIKHAHFLTWNLEGNPHGHYNNHYFTNGFGLFFLGIFLSKHSKGKKWLTLGKKIIERETEKQVLSDGVHYEQSIGYNKLILDILLSSVILSEKNSIKLSSNLYLKLEKMLDFTFDYTRNDGSTPMIGDCDDGRLMDLTPEISINDHRGALSTGCVTFGRKKWYTGVFYEESFWLLGGRNAYNEFLKISNTKTILESKAYRAGGYYIMKSENIHVIADCGSYGFHGHSDLLSFDLYAFNRPMVCDPGTYVYSSDYEWGNRFRSTYSHNVVGVDGKEANPFNEKEFWGLGKKNDCKVTKWSSKKKVDLLIGEHANYAYIQEDLIHRRKMILDKEKEIFFIHDDILGSGFHTLTFIFNLPPDLNPKIETKTVISKDESSRGVLITPMGKDKSTENILPTIKRSWVSYKFGSKLLANKICYTVKTELPFSIGFAIIPFINLGDVDSNYYAWR